MSTVSVGNSLQQTETNFRRLKQDTFFLTTKGKLKNQASKRQNPEQNEESTKLEIVGKVAMSKVLVLVSMWLSWSWCHSAYGANHRFTHIGSDASWLARLKILPRRCWMTGIRVWKFVLSRMEKVLKQKKQEICSTIYEN